MLILNKKMMIGLGLAVLLVTILTGCSTLFDSGDWVLDRSYYPNTDGYSWNYRLTVSTTSETGTLKVTFNGTSIVSSSIMVSSVAVQKLKYESTFGSNTSTWETLVNVSDTAVKTYGTADAPTTEANTVLAFPTRVGGTWVTLVPNEATVIAHEGVTVPAGTFSDCAKIRYKFVSIPNLGTTAQTVTVTFYGKGVGVLKEERTDTYTSGTSESTIVSTIELTSKNF